MRASRSGCGFNALSEDYVPPDAAHIQQRDLRTFGCSGRCHGGERIMASKLKSYEAEAEKCRLLAAHESCPYAREYYEALQRDYIKLASKALHEQDAAPSAN
jgi:hypothetical protein